MSHTSQLKALNSDSCLGFILLQRLKQRWILDASVQWRSLGYDQIKRQTFRTRKSYRNCYKKAIPHPSQSLISTLCCSPRWPCSFRELQFVPYPKVWLLYSTKHEDWEIVQLPSQLVALTTLFQPSSVSLQRGHLYVTVIPQTTIPMNMLQGKQPATSTCKMPPLRARAVKTILRFPKFQHQRTELGKGLASGTTWSVSPRTHSYKQTLFPSWNKACPNLSSLQMGSAGEKHPHFWALAEPGAQRHWAVPLPAAEQDLRRPPSSTCLAFHLLQTLLFKHAKHRNPSVSVLPTLKFFFCAVLRICQK